MHCGVEASPAVSTRPRVSPCPNIHYKSSSTTDLPRSQIPAMLLQPFPAPRTAPIPENQKHLPFARCPSHATQSPHSRGGLLGHRLAVDACACPSL